LTCAATTFEATEAAPGIGWRFDGDRVSCGACQPKIDSLRRVLSTIVETMARTQAETLADRGARRNRSEFGRRNLDIAVRVMCGELCTEIAREYGITGARVSTIVKTVRKTKWNALAQGLRDPDGSPELSKAGRRRLERRVRNADIAARVMSGENGAAIARQYGLTREGVRQIAKAYRLSE
jgi:Mor family transcriptional regulator